MSKIERLLIATHNEGKRKEFEHLLSPYVESVVSAAQINLQEPEETEDTFEGNARLKALAGARVSGMLTLADDSGFGIDALDGRPGVFSARFAKTARGHDYDDAAKRLFQELGDKPADAHFMCVLALSRPDGAMHVSHGRCAGQFIYPGRGSNGFGYDAYFIPEGHEKTFGEMGPEEKQPISHRGYAVASLQQLLKDKAMHDWLRHLVPAK